MAGITKINMTRNLKIICRLPDSELGEKRRASTAHISQIAPGKAIVFAGTEVIGGKALDYTGGTDGIIFDSVDSISSENAFPINRNEDFINPKTGRKCRLMKFCQGGGFIPLGAKLKDETEHPHAGSGFGLFFAQSIDADIDEKKGFEGSWAHSEDVYRVWELLQYKYDGNRFSVLKKERFSPLELLPGYTVINRAISDALPDGKDMLLGLQAEKGDIPESHMSGFAEIASGISRWKYKNDGWYPISYRKVTDGITAFEPSIVRDIDGSLLYSARQTGKDILDKFDVFVWRSKDRGESWELLFHAPKVRAESPVTINMIPDGKIFIAGNLLTASMAMRKDTSFGYQREILCFWELTEDRKWLKSPVMPKCARFEFGPPVSDRGWRIDHPISGLLKLGDGNWHCLMSFRVMDVSETKSAAEPTSNTGVYIEELLYDGPAEYEKWKF